MNWSLLAVNISNDNLTTVSMVTDGIRYDIVDSAIGMVQTVGA